SKPRCGILNLIRRQTAHAEEAHTMSTPKPPEETQTTPPPGDTDSLTTSPNVTPPSFVSSPSFPPPGMPEPAAFLSGAFGRYTILRPLGKGGMGTVYLAHDTELDRHVALKVPQLGGGDPHHLRERFTREARAAATLHHPHICPVYDVGVVGDIPYLTMA